MTLSITSLQLEDFRNYRRFEINDVGQITVLVGPNAVGKTNAIEGVQLVTAMTSFRHPKTAHLVREGASRARVAARAEGESRILDIALAVEDGKRRFFLNGKAKRPSDLKGIVPSVAFTPDDLSIIKGGNASRRILLDTLGEQLSASYHRVRKDYDEVLRSKNRLLRDEAAAAYLASVDEMVVRVGAQLTCYRAALFARLMPYLVGHYAAMSQGRDTLTARYIPSWSMESSIHSKSDDDTALWDDVSSFCPDNGDGVVSQDDEHRNTSKDVDLNNNQKDARRYREEQNTVSSFYEKTSVPSGADDGAGGDERSVASQQIARDEAREKIARALHMRAGEERARHRAVVGPHADHIAFYLDGRDASLFASQGQQRSIILAEKLAEVSLIEEMTGNRPVLLLDDVMSELDASRRAALMTRVDSGLQTFITTTNLSYFDDDIASRACVVDLAAEKGGE